MKLNSKVICSTDNEKVIGNFMRIEKDQTNEKNNSIRKSLRFQEKNIAKFLDSFNSSKPNAN